MAFTKALYYPYIRVQSESWLKTALLYWDTIQTIVPESIDSPYSGDVSREFADSGLLRPLKVNQNRREIEGLAEDALAYLYTTEAAEILAKDGPEEWAHIHIEKLSHELARSISRHFDSGSDEGGWLRISPQFGHYYMSLLASRLADNHGLGLLTDNGQFQNLADSNRLDAKFRFPTRGNGWRSSRHMAPELVQGYMANLILKSVKLAPSTSPKKIIKYREAHRDEIGRFREELSNLTKHISRKQTIPALQQELNDIYTNKVLPSLNDLKASLTDLKIKHSTNNFLKIGFFSVSITSIPLALLGMSTPYALLAGVGVNATLSAILYNREKKKILRDNPYSFVLSTDPFQRRLKLVESFQDLNT